VKGGRKEEKYFKVNRKQDTEIYILINLRLHEVTFISWNWSLCPLLYAVHKICTIQIALEKLCIHVTEIADPENFSQTVGNLVPSRERRRSFLFCSIEIHNGAPKIELRLYISPAVNTIISGY